MADASVSAEGNFQYHWIGSLYTSWLTLMRDVQKEPDSKSAAAKGRRRSRPHNVTYNTYVMGRLTDIS